MNAFSIDFTWWRDEAGYEFVPATPDNADRSVERAVEDFLPLSMGGEPSRRDRIVRRGGQLVPYRPFEHAGGIYGIFATLGKTDKGVLEFFTRFGPLTQAGLDRGCGEDLRFVRATVEAVNELLSFPIRERVSYFSRFGDKGLSWSRIDVALVFNPVTGKPQFRFTPPTLHNALWLEFGQVLSSDATMRNCVHCGAWFEAGPGTGRREDAKFCSDAHRIAFNSRRRSKGRAENG
jgi:hypothetical protein